MFAAVTEPLIYVDVSEVREGVLAELKEAIAELAEFIAKTNRSFSRTTPTSPTTALT